MTMRLALPIALAATLSLVSCKGEKGDPGPGGPTGPTGATGARGLTGPAGGPLLNAVTASGTNLGGVYVFDRAFPLTLTGGAGTANVAYFAVREGTTTPYLLMRILVTGTPMPCTVAYSAADCAGTAVGFPATGATGLACGGADGHAYRVVTSAAPTVTSFESVQAARWSGTDVVRECFNTPGGSQSLVPLEDLGAHAVIAERVHIEPG